MSRRILDNPHARAAAHRDIDAAPDGYVAEVKERTRTSDQNAALHALIGDIAKQKEWAGKRRSIDDWKALLISAHRIALQQAGDIIPGLEGEFVQLRKSTTQMGVKELGSLIDYVSAWAAMNEVKLSAPARMFDERAAA